MPRSHNQSSQRQRLFSLTTTNAPNHLSRSNTINGLLRISSDTVNVVKPTITTFVSRSAHAQPKFKYQEKREWANLDTPEDLEKRINRIRVSKRVCLLIVSQKPFNDHCLILAQHYLYPHHRLIVCSYHPTEINNRSPTMHTRLHWIHRHCPFQGRITISHQGCRKCRFGLLGTIGRIGESRSCALVEWSAKDICRWGGEC